MNADAGVSRKYRAAGWWRDETFLDDLRRHVAERPDKTAVAGRLVAQGRTDTISYAQLSELTGRIAHGLVDLGIEPGEYIGVQLHDCWEMLPLTLACLQAGVRIAPVPPEYRRAELEYMFRLTGARLFVTAAELHGGRPAEVALALAQELRRPEHVAVIGGGGPAGTLAFDEHFLARRPGTDLTGRRMDPDEPFLILFTSGTTGENKGAMHSPNTLYSGIRGYTEAFGLDDTLVMTTPHTNMHYAGLVTRHLTALFLGGTAVCADASTPAVSLELIEQHGVTMFYGSPSYVRDVLAAQRAQPRDTSSLAGTVSGSAPVPPQLLDEVRQVLGVRMFSLWGMSENGAVTITRPEDPLDWPAHSDGRPAGAMEVRIDPVAGRDDGGGSLWVRGPSQCLGYYRRDDVYAADLDAEGWFNTGDLARDDGRGGIRIVGRAKDIIIHRAANVPVAEIEVVLGKHPKVTEVALIGIPDLAVDEWVCAVVTAADGAAPTLDELRAYLRDAGVSSWCWPERVEVIQAMPRTPLGKIRKADLRTRYPAM
jgi:cyclohexanecarboxylate-CoA ligase